jgi:hypothetical protein
MQVSPSFAMQVLSCLLGVKYKEGKGTKVSDKKQLKARATGNRRVRSHQGRGVKVRGEE